MTKIEAIAHLENALKNNPEYRKKWIDYIEIVVTEELEAENIRASKIIDVRGRIAEGVLRLFWADWWEAQGDE